LKISGRAIRNADSSAAFFKLISRILLVCRKQDRVLFRDTPTFRARLHPDAIQRTAGAFESATGSKIGGLRDALASAPAAGLVPRATALFVSGAPRLAAAAGEALAFQGAGSPDARHLQRLVTAEDAAARAAAWRIVAYCAVPVPAAWYDAALVDDDPDAQRAARAAAAWTGSPAFASDCRARASRAAPEVVDAVASYAAVAPPEDYQLIGAFATDAAAGPTRFRTLGAFAHPYFVDLLIKEMENPDPAAAVTAGAAFTKMTGRDVESDRRVAILADGKPPADEFEAEFQEEVFLPDPTLARKHWQELAPTLARSPRICRGMDVSQPLSREQFAALDMESRWEHCLRARLYGGWQGTPLALERYPQRF
jgi:hypothetical protein